MKFSIREHAQHWATRQALPLCATNGFETHSGLFFERLNFQGDPIELPARRLMVQARQIATYSRAILTGLYKPDFAIDRCLDAMVTYYRASDGEPGWVFSISKNLEPSDRTRDLYAHAFVLYALAWSYRLLEEPRLLVLAEELLEVLDQHFLLEDGSFSDSVPAKDILRRQNPHMHLLEAFLAMAEASADERYLERARTLAKFGLTHFTDPETGLLLEELRADWTPSQQFGRNRVEPGHLFEWSWLLRELERMSGEPLDTPVARFLSFADGYGVDSKSGLIIDALTETGAVLEANFRCWPHAEAIKAHQTEAKRGAAEGAAKVDHYLSRLFDAFAPQSLKGGWIDRVNADGRPLVDHMPASSLYHIMGAIFELSA